jgi:hypothetical protein
MRGTVWKPRPDPNGLGGAPRLCMYVLRRHATKPGVVACCTVGPDGRLNKNSRTNFHESVLRELYEQVDVLPRAAAPADVGSAPLTRETR